MFRYQVAAKLRKQGKSYREIAEEMGIKISTVSSYLYRRKHNESFLKKIRRANQKYYRKNKKAINERKSQYWKNNLAILRRKRLTTVINGETITFYNLNKRSHSHKCELCKNGGRKLYYHHWDDSNPSKGAWLCNHCHQFVEWLEKGWDQKYLDLKKEIEKEFASRLV